MGSYSTRLDIYEYDKFRKEIKLYMLQNDLTVQDLARLTGYAVGTVYDSLNSYERCSRFFVAAIYEVMGEHEKNH